MCKHPLTYSTTATPSLQSSLSNTLEGKWPPQGTLTVRCMTKSLLQLCNTPNHTGWSTAQILYGHPLHSWVHDHSKAFQKQWQVMVESCDHLAATCLQDSTIQYNAQAWNPQLWWWEPQFTFKTQSLSVRTKSARLWALGRHVTTTSGCPADKAGGEITVFSFLHHLCPRIHRSQMNLKQDSRAWDSPLHLTVHHAQQPRTTVKTWHAMSVKRGGRCGLMLRYLSV